MHIFRLCRQDGGLPAILWLLFMFLAASVLVPTIVRAQEASGYSLRFYGHGVDDIDRAKIPVQTTAGSLPTDIGAADFTIDFWMRGLASENRGAPIDCGQNEDWIYGSTLLDRDRFAEGRKFGLSIDGNGRVVFGVTNQNLAARTICGLTNVLDGRWHHVAVQRRSSDGQLWLFVNGSLEATVTGPTGDLSYPDGVEVSFRGPGYCQGPGGAWGGYCRNEPFIVLGAEKHDAGASEGNPAMYPSFSGWLDELRLSNSLRYTDDFIPLFEPYTADGNTVGLYHFDEGPAGPCSGDLFDSAIVSGAPTNGACFYGGAGIAGPVYSTETPFTGAPALPTPTATQPSTPVDTPTVAPTATATVEATMTATPIPPTAAFTPTPVPPTPTNTPTSGLAANFALQFDGSNDFLSAGPSVGGEPLTVEMWLRPTTANETGIVVLGGDDDSGWSLEIENGRIVFWVRTNQGWQSNSHPTALQAGTWYHVAATYGSSSLRTFVNGLASTASPVGATLTQGSLVQMGAYDGFPPFAGALDDARISNSVRYTASFVLPTAPHAVDANTVDLWRFDEGAGQTAADSAGTPNDATLGASNQVDAADPTWVAGYPFPSLGPTATPTDTPLSPTALPATNTPAATNTPTPALPTNTPTAAPPTATVAATATATQIGAANYGVSFDGVDDVVIFNPVAHDGVLTVELWVRPARPSMEAIVVSQAGDNAGWSVELNGGRPALWVATNNGWEVARHATPLAANTWYHIAATYDNGAARLFVNGQPGAATTLQPGLQSVGNLRLGGIPGYDRFAGVLDDVRISQSVRYSAQFTPPPTLPAAAAATLGQWALNEGSGQTTRDGSTAGNHGRLGESIAADAADPAWVVVTR